MGNTPSACSKSFGCEKSTNSCTEGAGIPPIQRQEAPQPGHDLQSLLVAGQHLSGGSAVKRLTLDAGGPEGWCGAVKSHLALLGVVPPIVQFQAVELLDVERWARRPLFTCRVTWVSSSAHAVTSEDMPRYMFSNVKKRDVAFGSRHVEFAQASEPDFQESIHLHVGLVHWGQNRWTERRSNPAQGDDRTCMRWENRETFREFCEGWDWLVTTAIPSHATALHIGAECRGLGGRGIRDTALLLAAAHQRLAWAKVARANACALELPPASHNDVWQAASEGREPTRQRTGKRRRATTWMVEEVGRWVARRAEFIVLAHGSVDCCFGPVAPSAQDASLSQEYFHCIDMDGSGTLGISELKAILDSGTATDTPRGDPPGDATNRAQLLASQKQTHDVLRTVATEKRAAAEVGAAELLATFSAAKYEVRQLAQCEVQHQAALSLRSPHREPQPQPQLQPQPHATQHEPESDTADRPQSPDAFRDMCSALFKQIDIDGNGVLTKKEMKKGMDAIKSGFGLSLKAKDVLKAADMDGDQLIDAKEFYQFMRGVLPDMSTGVDQRAANTECESVRFSAVGDHVADAAVVLGGATAPSGAEAAAKDISSKAVLAKTGATAEHEEVLNNAQAVAHEKQLHASNESLVAQVARLKAHECAAAEEETESQNVRLGAEPEPEPRSTAGAQQPASTWASRKKASIEAQQRQSTQPPSDAFRDMCDALFDSIDIDGDGELTLQEIKKGLGMMRGFGVNMKANAFFKAADVDGSKSVDREEFHTFMRAQLYPTKPKLNPKLNPIPNPDPNLPTFEVVEVEDDRAHALHAFAKHASPDAHGGDSAAIGVKDCTPSRAAEAAEAVEAAAPARDGFRKQCNTLFREIDTNGDGLLTKKEIKKGIDAINSSTGLSLKAKAIFKAADTDGSKELDADEFHAFMRSAMPDKAATAETAAEVASQQPPRDAAYREMCDALFDSVDIDADGMLTLKEIKSGLGLINSVSPRLYLKAKAIFEAAGVDGSKLVDKDQFYNFMKGGQD